MANITLTLYWNLDDRRWTSDLLGTTAQGPVAGLVQGDTVVLNVRFVQSGVAVTLTAPVFTASSIKASGDFTGSYLIQLSAPVLSETTLYTFTVSPLNSANLNTFLQTYRNTWSILEIYDSANGILTTPLELQITPGYSLSGTPTDNAPGVISVAAGKTVTFPLTLTFPSALGTNGFQLTYGTGGTLTWEAAGGVSDGDKGEITVSNSGATWTIDNDVITLAKLAHMPTDRVIGRTTPLNGSPELLTISGTGSVAMTTNPQFTTPSLGAATATSINGMFISSSKVTTASVTDTSNVFHSDAIHVYPVLSGQTWQFIFDLTFQEGGTGLTDAQIIGPTADWILGNGTINTGTSGLSAIAPQPAFPITPGTSDGGGYIVYSVIVTASFSASGNVVFQWRSTVNGEDITIFQGSISSATRIS